MLEYQSVYQAQIYLRDSVDSVPDLSRKTKTEIEHKK